MNKKIIIGIVLMLITICSFSGCVEVWHGSGIITDKFRTASIDGIRYYFVIDEQFDVEVLERIYYNMSIGDFYEQ